MVCLLRHVLINRLIGFIVITDKHREEDKEEDDDKNNEKGKEKESEAIRERYLGISPTILSTILSTIISFLLSINSKVSSKRREESVVSMNVNLSSIGTQERTHPSITTPYIKIDIPYSSSVEDMWPALT